jgi:RNA polymerase sigma-70 factor (ECF subfamily)
MDDTLWVPFEAWKTRPSPAGLIALLEASRPLVYTLCRQVLRHPQDAEDASQLVLLELIDKLGEIKDTTRYRHWIHRACFHVALNLKRSQRRRQEHEREKAERSATTTPSLPADCVHEHLANLDAETRALLVSRYFERRSVEDLAASSGCSTVTVWKRLEKARHELLQSLVRSGLATALPDLDAVLDSTAPVTAPAASLGADVLAKAGAGGSGSASWASVLGGGVLTLKGLAAVLLIGLAGAGLLAVAARRQDPPPLTASSRLPQAHPTLSPGTSVPSAAPRAEHPDLFSAAAHPESPASNEVFDAKPLGSPVLSSIINFMKMQNQDGSWGDGTVALGDRTIDKTGVSSLALLAFLGAGYSQLSIDEYEKHVAGKSVRRALTWILQGQREDGTFATRGDPAVDQAITTLALSEAYGMTASQPLKEPVHRAVQALVRMQSGDGSWGSATASYWAAEAFASAELSEVAVDPDAMTRVRTYVRSQLDAGPNLAAMTGHMFLNRERTHPGLAQTCARVADVPPDLSHPDMMYSYMSTLAIFQYEGPEGATWKRYGESVKRSLLQTGQEGFWQGKTQSDTILQSSLATLALETVYRYANVFGQEKPGNR